MKSHFKGVAGRILSIILVMIMVMSMCSMGIVSTGAADVDLSETAADLGSDSLASTGASGVSGDSTLFDKLNSGEPYLKLEKSTYDIDTPILVTAANGTRLGLYASSVTAPTSSDTVIYTYDLTGHHGQTIDLLTGVYNTSSSVRPYLADTSYNLFLFADDGYTVAAGPLKVTVDNANRSTFDKDDVEISLQTNRFTYTYGEPIIVKARGLTNYPNAWVGIYPKGAATKTTAAEYILPVGTGYGSTNGTNYYHNKNTDIVAKSLVNKTMELVAGDYDVHLFSDKSPSSTKLTTINISVKYANMRTYKTSFGYGEDVAALAEVYDTSEFSIANTLSCTGSGVNIRKSVPSGTAITTAAKNEILTLQGTAVQNNSNWAYIKNASGSATGYISPYLSVASGSDVKIYGLIKASVPLRSAASSSYTTLMSLTSGMAYNYLGYQTDYYIKVQVGGYTGYVYRNGVTNTSNFSILYKPHNNSAKPTLAAASTRVGFYEKGATPGGSDTVGYGYYYVKDYNKRHVIIQDAPNGVTLEPKNYTFHLFGDSSYTDAATANITVNKTVDAKFAKGVYEVDNLTDGYANGRVAFEIDIASSYGYVGNGAKAVVYWAGSDKKPLPGYGSFNPVSLDKNVVGFEMQPYTVIPEGATGLVAYIEFNGVQSTTGYYLALPSGCKTFTGLDKGIISEFNVISDSKLGNTNTSYHYNDNYVAALTDIANNGTNSQAIIINGDITNNGAESQFALVDSFADEVKASTGKTLPSIYGVHGNTDDNDGMGPFIDFINSHGGNITEEVPYYSLMIDGHKNIFLASDDGDGKFTATQLAWLDAELADNEKNNDGKAVFVYSHYVPENTVLKAAGGKVENTDEFGEVTSKYNNVFCFTGHGLASMRSLDNTYGGDVNLPVVINASSSARTRRFIGASTGNWEEYDNLSSEGLYVRTYEDKTVVLGRDFINSLWVPEALYVFQNNDLKVTKDDVALALNESIKGSEYIVNEKGRTLSIKSLDTSVATVASNGDVTPKAPGNTSVVVSALATNTEVVGRGKLPLRIFETIDRNYYLRGSFNSWSEPVLMSTSLDADIVTTTLELKRGSYDLQFNNFEDWYVGSVTVVDNTEEPLELITKKESDLVDSDIITLKSSIGGIYTFDYSISSNSLSISCIPFDDDGGVVGDSALIDKVTSSDPYIYMDKETYNLGESIYVTASGGVWVGLYKAGVTDYSNTKSTYWYYTEDYDGVAVDIRTITLNNLKSEVNPALEPGSYQVVLFETSNAKKPIDSIEFDVLYENNNSKTNGAYIATDKATYKVGEPVKIIAQSTNNTTDQAWVGVYAKGATPSTSEYLHWYYLVKNNLDRNWQGQVQILTEASTQASGKNLPAGEYDVYLFGNRGYTLVQGKVTIKVTSGTATAATGTVNTSKDVYGRYEDIIVTATSTTEKNGAWVGIYAESTLKGKTPTGSSGLKAWYYIKEQDSYTEILQELVNDSNIANPFTSTEAVAGDYSVYVFGDSGYTDIQAKTTFTIVENVTGSFQNGVYQLEKLYDGFANGKVYLEVSNDSCGYIGTADATLYWADADGNPLEGYTALHKAYVDSTVIVVEMNSHTIIPEGAESLVAYMSSYKDTMGTEPYKITLPDGSDYTDLDKNIITEFNLITDSHLTSDEVTKFDNGLDKYHSWQQDTSNEYFQKVLEDIALNGQNSAGIFINGDVTNNGFAQEYAMADTIYNSVETNLGVELPPMYASMGNHDTFIGSNSTYVDFVNAHGGEITSDAPYYSKTVDGYKFIFLAGDNPDYYGRGTAVENSSEAELSDAQLQWLDAELADNEANGGKPVFILLHQAVEDTVAGTLDTQDWDGLVNVDEFMAVVEKYDNVLLMGGHSHWILDSPKNLFAGSEELPVAINLGSTSYGWTDYVNASSGTVMVAQGFYVKMYEDKVVFLGRDFTNNLWIPGACYVLYNDDVQAESVVMEAGDTVTAEKYLLNLLDRNLTFTSSDPAIATVAEDGTITGVSAGDATITVYAAPTNTEVIKREKLTVTVKPYEGQATNYFIKGGFDDWGTGLNLVQTKDPNVVSGTMELAQGVYEFKVNNGNTWYGNTGTIEDTTDKTAETGWVMSSTEQTNCTLKATGGTYTFSFNTSTKALIIKYEPASTEETGANTATIYVDFKNSDFESTPYIYIWDPERESLNKNIGPLWPGQKLEGPNAEGYYYRTFKYDESYQFIINDGNGLQTADSAVHTEEEVYVIFSGGTEYTEGKPAQFWIDLNPDDDTSKIDLLYPELINGTYYFFLPSGYNAKSAEFHMTEGTTLIISRITIKDGGVMNLSAGVNKTRTYALTGDYSGKFMVKQSSSIASLYTYTNEMLPTEIGYGGHKDDYSSKGSIMMMNSDATVRLETSDLKKIKGRGNSTWEASNTLIGKYAFNITLNESTVLIGDGSESKKYCLVSFNSDEARMRNMVVYDLAKAIGVEFVADYEPVDLYNNGRYIGTYLLTDKVEIGDPLVDITDLDKINEKTSDNNAAIYDGDIDAVVNYGGPAGVTGKDDNSTPGFFKFVQNLDEPDATTYAESGFLLEFELNERFADEATGFISAKGQQIVCKYPEYATYNEMIFIMSEWAKAEDLIYNENASYEELNAIIDVESFAKMYLIQELTKNLDAGATSYYVYYDGGKFHAGVAWDYDWTLGQYIQSGYEHLSVENQTSGKFADEAKKLLNDPEGWWANSKEIYPNTDVLNAQAALCQNEVFWNVVKAEWNEIFYSTAISYTGGTVSATSGLANNFAEYYSLIKGSTAMDEFKWGIIKNDPLASWGSTDTGDTHDAAVIWLNNFYYTRLQWMNERLASTDYNFAPVTLTSDKDSYGVGEYITLTATCNSSGTLTYNFYNGAGELVKAVETTEGKVVYEFVAADEIDEDYTVIVTTENTTSEEATDTVHIVAKRFNFAITTDAPERVPAGLVFNIVAGTNAETEVLYYLYDEAGELLDANYSGDFSIITSPDEAGITKDYTIEATTDINGIVYSVSTVVTVELVDFKFEVTLTAPESVEAGMDALLTATSKSTGQVTYTFYDATDNSELATNPIGTYLFETSKKDMGQTRSFYVVAETIAFGHSYTAQSDIVNIMITEITDVYNVVIYFKSTSTIGYKPMITTSGTVEDLADEYMEADMFITKNESETASYYWYKSELEVSKKSPSIFFRIVSSRYAMEVQANLTITEDKTYYFAVDNLNSGTEIVNLTDAPEKERNWCESALHMVYDPAYDSAESLAEISARVDLRYVGDTTADGMVNIRDATYIQKYLAELVEFNSTDKEVADVDSDYKITIKDATRVQKKLAGLL